MNELNVKGARQQIGQRAAVVQTHITKQPKVVKMDQGSMQERMAKQKHEIIEMKAIWESRIGSTQQHK